MQPTKYYISRDDGPQQGPHSLNQLGLFISTARLKRTDLIWKDGLDNWRTCASLPEIAALFPGDASPVSTQAVPPPRPALVPALAYAGFWSRVLACIIDSVILLLALIPVNIAFLMWIASLGPGGVKSLMTPRPFDFYDPLGISTYTDQQLQIYYLNFACTLIIKSIYYACFDSSRLQGTPGKLALGLKVVMLDGGRLTLLRAFARFYASLISAIPLGIGYLIALLSRRGQTFHDMLVNTLVLRRRP